MGSTTKLQIANLSLSLIGAKNLTTFGETTTEEGKRVNATYAFIRDEVLMEHPWSFAQKRVALVDMTRPDIDDWVTATAYAVDDIIYSSTGYYYKCLVAHTSGVFATDLAAADWVLNTTWVTGTVYTKGDFIYNSGVHYACLVNHTAAAAFATDLALVYWVATEFVVDDMDDELTNVFYLPTDFLKVNRLSDTDAVYELVGNRLLADTDSLAIKYTYSNDDPTLYSAMFVTALACRLAAEICFNLTQSRTKAKDILDKYEGIDLPRAMSADSAQGTPEGTEMYEWEESRL